MDPRSSRVIGMDRNHRSACRNRWSASSEYAGVMLSVEQFERLRGTAWDGLAASMDAMSQEAAANDLTPAALESLPSEES